MNEALTPRLLDKSTIDRAFLLVRNLVPAMTHERWSRFARPHLSSRSPHWPRGLMAIQNPGGYILGLFVFEVRDDLYQSRALCIDNVIVPSLQGRDLVWTAIADAIEHLAAMNGCRVIRAGLADDLDPADTDRAWLSVSLEKAGYSLEGARAVKRVESSSTAPSH